MNTFERRTVWVTSWLVALTGFVYLYMKYALTPAQPWDVTNHPLQGLALKVHIVSAPLLVFAVGMIATRHIWRHFRTNVQKARRTGLATALVLGPMIVSGYLIQSIAHESWLRVVALTHIATSVVFALGLIAHWWYGRRPGPRYPESVEEVPPAGRWREL